MNGPPQLAKNLQQLDLNDTPVTDAGVKQLAGLTGLKALRLDFTQATDVGLRQLAGLYALNLGVTKVTYAGLRELTGLTRLQSLDPRRDRGDRCNEDVTLSPHWDSLSDAGEKGSSAFRVRHMGKAEVQE